MLGAGSVWSLINNLVGDQLVMAFVGTVFVLSGTLYAYPQFWWIWLPPLPIFFFFSLSFE